jgi:hypothetical protein
VVKLWTSLNALAAASVLAAALMTLPPGLAFAADNNPRPTKSPAQQSCESRGYGWIDGQCADKKCFDRASGAYTTEPGSVVTVMQPNGLNRYYMCNGLTGLWERIIIQPGDQPPPPPPPTASR